MAVSWATVQCKEFQWSPVRPYAMIRHWICTLSRCRHINRHGKPYPNTHWMQICIIIPSIHIIIPRSSIYSIRLVGRSSLLMEKSISWNTTRFSLIHWMIINIVTLYSQMHGYDADGMPPMHPGPMTHPHGGPHSDTLGHHPDSTDSYVTYLESDDSIQASP